VINPVMYSIIALHTCVSRTYWQPDTNASPDLYAPHSAAEAKLVMEWAGVIQE